MTGFELAVLILCHVGLAVVLALMVAVDLRAKIIPNQLTLVVLLLGLVVAMVDRGLVGLPYAALQAVAVLIALVVVSWGLRRLKANATLGWGDVKFLAATAAWVGVPGAVWALILGSLLIASYGLAAKVGNRDMALSQTVPFAPALVAGFVGVLLLSHLLP